MPSTEQINANRENAKLSTGPTSQTGSERSSQNATKHGFTGLNLVVTPAEKEAYEQHVFEYLHQYAPLDHKEKQLTHQLADLDWSLHQISVQQLNTISQMNAATTIMAAAGDPVATAALLASLSRTLNNLSIYEGRRRRASKAIKEELEAVQKAAAELLREELPKAATIYKIHKAKGQDWDPQEFGFVCSMDAVLGYLEGQELAAEARMLQTRGQNQPSL
jgi:hypothetical protein